MFATLKLDLKNAIRFNYSFAIKQTYQADDQKLQPITKMKAFLLHETEEHIILPVDTIANSSPFSKLSSLSILYELSAVPLHSIKEWGSK